MSSNYDIPFTNIQRSNNNGSKKKIRGTIQNPIKEGFLVKKGHVRHNWKTRWFILYPNELVYFKNRGDNEPAGTIHLQGASLILSPRDYRKREDLFLITCGAAKRDFLLQALDEPSRDVWCKAIERQIRAAHRDVQLSMSMARDSVVSMRKLSIYQIDPEHSALDVRDILQAMQDTTAGIKLQTIAVDGKKFQNSFTASSVVDWLMSWCFANTRIEGCRIGQDLLRRGHIQTAEFADKPVLFQDNKDDIYRFVTLRQNTVDELISEENFMQFNRHIYPTSLPLMEKAVSIDSSYAIIDHCEISASMANKLSFPMVGATSTLHEDFCMNSFDSHNGAGEDSSSSEDFDDENDVFSQADLGNIVLQGFLLKKCHGKFINPWKKRKFVLRDKATKLYYFDGAKLSNSKQVKPSGSINLISAQVHSGKSDDHNKIFEIYNSKGKKLKISAANEEERQMWIYTIQTHIEDLSIRNLTLI